MPFIWIDQGNYSKYIPRLSPERVHKVHTSEENSKTNEYSSEENSSHALNTYPGSSKKNTNPYQEIYQSLTMEEGRAANLVRQIMQHTVVTAPIQFSIEEVLSLMHRNKIRHVPIIDSNHIMVGIVSERDILKGIVQLLKEDPSIKKYTKSIEEVMTKKVLTARPEARISDAAKIMLEEKIGCLPVINEDNKMLGIVTRTDILKNVLYYDKFQEIA